MKRILILTHEFLPFRGGIASYVHNLATAAAKMGNEVTVVAPDYFEDQSEHDAQLPYSVTRFRAGRYSLWQLPALLIRFPKLVQWRAYDIIHAADWPFFLLLGVSNRFWRLPFVATAYGSEILRVKNSFRSRVLDVQAAIGAASTIFAISNYTRRLLLESFPSTNDDQVVVAYLGVDRYWFTDLKPEYNRQIYSKFGIPESHDVVLTVARLDSRKGHITVFDALAQLPPQLKQKITYVVVGTGNDHAYTRALHERADRCGVNTVFTGPVLNDELHALYSRAAIFCMPGEEDRHKIEGFGLVYLEAAARGVPSIASSAGAVPEVVLDRKTGLLVEPQDTIGVFNGLVEMLSNPSHRAVLGEAARGFAGKFSWENCAKQTYNL